MALLPLAWARAASGLLRPLRALVAQAWLREADVDLLLQALHPAWRLNRVLAQVERREWVAEDMLALTLRCNGNAGAWQPGQHLQLFCEQAGVRLSRSYSLTAVHGDGRIELAIKRQPGGRLSNYLLDHLAVGQVLELGQASGRLQWPQTAGAGVLLLAAGSGITPLLGLLRLALAEGFSAPITLLHYVRSRSQRAFSRELQGLQLQHPNLQVRWAISAEPATLDELSGRFQASHLAGLPGASLLVCGPHGFVASVRQQWAGELQSEAFSLPPAVPAVGLQLLQLQFARSQLQVTGDNASSLLVQAEQHGLRPVHGCRQGICSSCTCTLVSGAVRDLRSGGLFSEPGQPIRICVSVPQGDVVVDL
ncbi:MAG: iron-sulfur cluster-binding domain-containing protein [Pseudomonas sp.]|nr:iron-sulfur cluster-binding domain-containing protein [Pseudomonas sp.]